MNGGSRIIAIGTSGEGQAEETGEAAASPDQALDLSDWAEQDGEPLANSGGWRAEDWIAAILAVVAVLGWSGFYAWANRSVAAGEVAPTQWASLVAGWTMPVMLVCLIWLIFMRSSTREAVRFGETARLVSAESASLETRLVGVNRELSLAREFIAAQARDLESLGRIASERLSTNADRLQALVSENSSRVETIAQVSETALENMEKLRGQLPVIASSAKDVTNNIANAGRTAHGQIEELVRGFNRLNEFGQASEAQVFALRDHVNKTLTHLGEQCVHLETIANARFAELNARGDDFRTRLDSQEVEALAAIRTRANALAEELDAARSATETAERQALELLGARLVAIRTESDEIEQALIERAATHREDADEAASRAEALAERLSSAQSGIADVARNAQEWQDRVGQTVSGIAGQMADARNMIEATEGRIGSLIEASVRLFELVHASATQAGTLLPEAMTRSDAALSDLEQRASALAAAMKQAGEDGAMLAGRVDASQAGLGDLIGKIDTAQQGMREKADEHLRVLEGLAGALTRLDEQNDVVAGKARTQLGEAIAELEGSARQTLGMIESQGAAGIERISKEIQTRSAQAVGLAIHKAAAEISGQLEQAASHAAGVSREAAIQLRDQLAKVNELVANLESRVTRARERAEEQIDNDFSRRAALITESLNSNAIDIAKALSADVSNTAWEGYLRGDRGIFTRRAVSLIDNGEAKSIQQAFERDDEFRDHVSRYIHDFEAMLRQILSTRDGKALGVTLLSSDMGKLYVALAQAIERLRT
jgi:hypothetical protein